MYRARPLAVVVLERALRPVGIAAVRRSLSGDGRRQQAKGNKGGGDKGLHDHSPCIFWSACTEAPIGSGQTHRQENSCPLPIGDCTWVRPNDGLTPGEVTWSGCRTPAGPNRGNPERPER